MNNKSLKFMAAVALTLVAVSAQAATVEQEIDNWSKLVSKQDSTYPGRSDALDLAKARDYNDEVLKEALDSSRSKDLAESDDIKKTFDLDYRDHLGKSDDLGEELFENNPMPVPEAGTSAMMLMGVGLMAFVVRRRRKFL